MRKQTKVAAIVSAAALLVIGASMTSMASVKGTWRMVDGEWMCFDSNGDAYTDVFATSNGKDFYVGDDGYLVRSDWVEYDGDYYFVNSSGQKITNDWRLTTPYDDEDAEEEWFYFQSTGKRAENKKITYKNNTYYFDSDGVMLTGWVTYADGVAVDEASSFDDGNTYYCSEDGARLSNTWVYDVEPGTEDDDADADEYWYYIGGKGKPETGKKTNINGQIYLFDEDGKMLYGWVGGYETPNDKGGTDTVYEMLTDRDDDEDSSGISIEKFKENHPSEEYEFYYCGEEDDGHAKKNKWVKIYVPGDKDGKTEGKTNWYWFDKNGKLFYSTDTPGETGSDAVVSYKYKFDDGQVVSDNKKENISSKKINSKTYWFNESGEMIDGFRMIGGELYYFGGGNDGVMKTGAQTISDGDDDYKFYFNTSNGTYDDGSEDGTPYSKGSGVTGNKNNKLYYYGMLIQADDYKYQIADVEGHKFVVNTSGTIQHSSSNYKEDGDVIIVVDDEISKDHYDTNTSQWKYEIIDNDSVNQKGNKTIDASELVVVK